MGKTAHAVLPALEPSWMEAFSQVVASGNPVVFEKYSADMGKHLLVSTFRTAPDRFACLFADITEQKRAEQEQESLQLQFLQAQKMESIGRLAGGVAHDFNNMLGVIIGYTEMAINKVEPSQPLHAHLLAIKKAAERSADLTRQLLAFARKQTVEPKVLELNETVESMLKLLRKLIGENIELSWMPHAGLWLVKIDPAQIDQILANLCVNARDAIAGEGKLTIATRNVTMNEAYCTTHVDCTPGEYVLLTVNDTGCGMDKETVSQIFEPFFTTKETGKGTGLGLATVYGIIKQNHGHITVYSEPGQGTTFKVFLPRHLGELEQTAALEDAEPQRSQGEVVLMVEDDAAILAMCRNMLEGLGYKVLAANSPAEALRIAETHSGVIQLLLTDVIMPEMNGQVLAERLKAARPGLRVLFMSGYTADIIADHGVLDTEVHFIEKPFNLQKLSAKIRLVLAMEQTGR
jgi:signal transduction histidine kinase/CheY-like chemotaxis protein